MKKPTIYAVQYRDMHTACHRFALIEDPDVATVCFRCLAYCKLHYRESPTICNYVLDDVEIDYRRPPTEYHHGRTGTDYQVIIVNNNNIPDVY